MGRIVERLAIVAILIFILPSMFIQYVDLSLRPVITPLMVTAIEPYGEDSSRITGHATRLRNCSWQRTEWFLGRRDNQRVPVDVDFLDPPEVREEGFTEWTGIIVGLTPSQVLRFSHADVVYQCYRGLFARDATQPFYDGDGRDAGLLEAEK